MISVLFPCHVSSDQGCGGWLSGGGGRVASYGASSSGVLGPWGGC
jgi:hypothetical protein